MSRRSFLSFSLPILLVSFLCSLQVSGQGTTWHLARNHSGSTFFDKWIFYNGVDTNTTGNVLFQTREQATTQKLIGVTPGGNAYLKVDNTTNGAGNPTFGRPSVKVYSDYTIEEGSLLIFDAVNIPYGCGVWPAYWTQGSNWPDDGEIDIIENVNLATANQYALHTLNGCRHQAPSPQFPELGNLDNPDCFNQTNGNEGCLVQETQPNSFGVGFKNAGGGVTALLWDKDGMKIWFFTRSKLPADLAAGGASPNPGGWGTPSAVYSSTACDFGKFFGPQSIILDITLCGNFAGLPAVFQTQCGNGLCTDLIADPANWNNAYFEMKYLAVFSNVTQSPSATVIGGSPSSPTGGSGSGSGSSGSGAMSVLLGRNGFRDAVVFAMLVGVGLVVLL